jgi:hypothetical protein
MLPQSLRPVPKWLFPQKWKRIFLAFVNVLIEAAKLAIFSLLTTLYFTKTNNK